LATLNLENSIYYSQGIATMDSWLYIYTHTLGCVVSIYGVASVLLDLL